MRLIGMADEATDVPCHHVTWWIGFLTSSGGLAS